MISAVHNFQAMCSADCETGFTSLRNRLFDDAEWTVSGHETGCFTTSYGLFCNAILTF